MDALSSRLKIAQFIAKTLSVRLEELQQALNRVKTSSSSSSTDSWGSAPKTPPGTQPANLPDAKFKKDMLSRPSPPALVRRHTTTAVGPSPLMSGTPGGGGGWEERAAAFMLKRQSQRSAMEQQNQQIARDPPRTPISPLSSPTESKHRRQLSHSSDIRPVPGRSTSDKPAGMPYGGAPKSPNQAQDQDVLWELERRRQNPRRGALLAAAWTTYQDSWEDLNTRIGEENIEPYLTFATVPWPVLRVASDPQFSDPNEIGIEEVKEFVLSPFHSTNKSKEARIRDAYMRWHPDKSSRWLEFVVKSERGRVKDGVERVNWCLNNLK
ncbi:hypothetical protein M408DRAFT_146774 [Serendipita vermifera MAFF 305830]|uniref:Uncharacterized protein n=1 Tax=Serendipita vermifera MAFF 305830 TaxID=933852 RepID=A0A0C2WP34_SERVB|nr:hypothetical protein M408DRAFT_146774 [Serendipita vermifera MAFF 305830]